MVVQARLDGKGRLAALFFSCVVWMGHDGRHGDDVGRGELVTDFSSARQLVSVYHCDHGFASCHTQIVFGFVGCNPIVLFHNLEL